MLMNFLTILAWIGAVGGGIATVFGAYTIMSYEGSIEQKLDKMRGVRVRWPMQKWFFLTTLLSIVFLIAKAMS